MEFKTAKLDNGLEIVAEVSETAYSVAIGYFVQTGARDETDQESGISHFLEHMVFKGTPTRSALAVNRELDNMGGISNACTGEESTIFYASVLPELEEKAVDLFSDLMRPSLSKEDFDMEKQVILEEISLYKDQPPFDADEKCREIFFQGHPLARSIGGTKESVSALTIEQMRDYFERQYSSDNITIVACGRVDFNKFVDDVARHCAHWKPYHKTRKTFRPRGKRGTYLMKRKSAAQEYLFQVTDAPCARDTDRYAASLLANILGDETGSRIFWELVDSGRVDYAGLGFQEYSDAGTMCATMSCDPEKISGNLTILRDVFRKAESDGIFEEELERSKNKILSRLVQAGERPRGRLFGVGIGWMQCREYYSVQNIIEIIRNLTVDDINAVLKKYPLSDPLTVAVGPLDAL